jgi:FkbM family methyltransferase
MSNYTKFGLLENVNIILELGTRDCKDAVILASTYKNATIYAFEANPEAWPLCEQTLNHIHDSSIKNRVLLVKKAALDKNGPVVFRPFDIEKYDNIGASSLFEINFTTNRLPSDPDYGRTGVQKQIEIEGTRIDTWCEENNIHTVDMLCMDLQGAELLALKGLGHVLHSVRAIISETCIESTYIGGSSFQEMDTYLQNYGFSYVCSDGFGRQRPPKTYAGFSEFNAVWMKT